MNRIKELREVNGLSVRACAIAAGLTPSTLLRIEKGERKVSTAQAIALANYFGVTIEYILECDNEQKATAHPNRLRELRKAMGLTTEELGKAIGLDSSMITHIERGDKNFSVDSLIRACDYFGVSADYMLKRKYHAIPDKQSDGCPNRLRELRKAKGLTSIQVAKILQLSESAVRYIERGDRDFSIASLTRACDYFGVTTDYMLNRDYLAISDKQSDGCPNRLRELRRAKGLTLRELAEKTGADYSTLGYIERGEHNFSIESLTRICDYFGVTTDYMLKRTEVSINV